MVRLNELPIEIQDQIFSYLDWGDHIACMEVCTLWREIFRKTHLLRHRFLFDSKWLDGKIIKTETFVFHQILVFSVSAIVEFGKLTKILWKRRETSPPRNIADSGVCDDPVFYPLPTDANGTKVIQKTKEECEFYLWVTEKKKGVWGFVYAGIKFAMSEVDKDKITIKQMIQWIVDQVVSYDIGLGKDKFVKFSFQISARDASSRINVTVYPSTLIT